MSLTVQVKENGLSITRINKEGCSQTTEYTQEQVENWQWNEEEKLLRIFTVVENRKVQESFKSPRKFYERKIINLYEPSNDVLVWFKAILKTKKVAEEKLA